MPKETIDILIVDDQVGIRRLLSEALADEGYQVKMAGSGAEALNILSSTLPSLILLDLKMPGMTGLETLQEIRKHHGQLTVVMMTAYSEVEIMDQTMGLGVKHFLNKPFDLDEVRALVKGLLKKAEGLKLLQQEIC
ncbi:response regulator [Desulforamulus ferrireducens]|uniref:Stage 0 sporulation protein A homolog n=1 Tax=Desulforamulus ferrireducens TaxID=1833852 RepID=A0A1S6J052_9FIRM|nr:response regulator [Desulforamulus ferrireducens]AQS60404.1 two-component system response regulator [Desulforamulus ferrireducens]